MANLTLRCPSCGAEQPLSLRYWSADGQAPPLTCQLAAVALTGHCNACGDEWEQPVILQPHTRPLLEPVAS